MQAATIVDHICPKTEPLEDDLKNVKKFPVKQLQQQEKVKSMEIDNGPTVDIKVKTEKPENTENMEIDEKRAKKHSITEEVNETEPQPPAKVWKGVKYKIWSAGTMQPPTKFKKPTERELTEVNN